MENIKVYEGQSLLDVSVQYTGSVENCFIISDANGKSITDILTAGSQIKIPETTKNNEVLNYYQNKHIKPATEITNPRQDETAELEGISIWIINKNFIVQ